jgi:hypothetical protein
MRPFWSRFLRQASAVGIALGVIGYLLAHGFLFAHRMYAGGAYNPENERVLWQTPVVMAALGVLMCGGIGLLTEMFRRPAVVKAATPPVPDSVV